MLLYAVDIKVKRMIAENLKRLTERVGLASKRAGRNPEKIKIVAVTKTATLDMIKQALEAGITDIGENRVQEAQVKFLSLENQGISFTKHLVGHLQTNKVKQAVRLFDLIQSVDTIKLAQEINKQAEKISKYQDILIEVKTSPEVTKSGFKPEEVIEVIKEIEGLKNLNLKGLMTIAPLVDEPQKVRPYFKQLRELLEEINAIRILSMGMTDDFEVAIEEGSNMIRIGRGIFS